MRAPALFDLSGKTALVTGGGRGIGRHLSLGLAEAGADVFIASRNQAACEEAAREIHTRTGRRAVALAADVSQPDSVSKLVEAVLAQTPRLDVLVNNAGVTWAAPTLDYPLAGWERVFAVNVRGLFLLTQQVARHMRERGGGTVVQISSVSAFGGAREEDQPVVAYPASKAAVLALTRDLAVKLAPHRIRVNAIAPGPFLTDMMNHIRNDAEKLRAFETRVPLGRCGGEDDIKGAVVFLASEASAFVTGATLVVDGGMCASA